MLTINIHLKTKMAVLMKTLSELCEKVQCKLVDSEPNLPYDQWDEWQLEANYSRVQLRYKGRQLTLDFWQSVGITNNPDSEGVLDCLLSDSSGVDENFEDWAANYGYDTDSRKAEKIYNLCKKQSKKTQQLLGNDFDMFLDSER